MPRNQMQSYRTDCCECGRVHFTEALSVKHLFRKLAREGWTPNESEPTPDWTCPECLEDLSPATDEDDNG